MAFLMEVHGTNQVLGPASSEFGVWFVGSTFIGSFVVHYSMLIYVVGV